MSTSRMHQLGMQNAALQARNDELADDVADLRMQVSILEQRVKGLRGLGSPGLVIEALGDITEMADDMVYRTQQAVVFWTTVKEWAEKLRTEEKEEWGDLVDGTAMDLRNGAG